MKNYFIEISELIVFANHGVLPEEKTMGQKFSVSLRLYADMSKAAATDDILEAVNYAEVCSFVTEFTKTNTNKLIEAAAENIAFALLDFQEILTPLYSKGRLNDVVDSAGNNPVKYSFARAI